MYSCYSKRGSGKFSLGGLKLRWEKGVGVFVDWTEVVRAHEAQK